MIRPALLLLCVASFAAATSDLKQKWESVTTAVGHSEWGVGLDGERRGQICDPHRRMGQTQATTPDALSGCVVLFIADPDDAYTVKELPANQQDNFQNTQHYESALTLHGEGFDGNSMPRAPQDLHPVCYIANINGQTVLGYEEGNGDKLLPCPGTDDAPLSAEVILDPNADLEGLCAQCYTQVCSSSWRKRPQDCGHIREGGVDVGEQYRNDPNAQLVAQATPAYHCHLTMADEGTCDYVQHEQLEAGREYNMNYTVMCGWEKVSELRVSYCDCTLEHGRDDNCQRQECLAMALEGVVCSNCRSCNHNRAYQSIFNPKVEGAEGWQRYHGTCAKAKTGETEAERNYNEMLCSKGLNCDTYAQHSGCEFHCSKYGRDSEVWADTDCPEPPASCEVEGFDGTGVQAEGSDKCFFVPEPSSSGRKTWADAEASCQSYGGHLASILSEEENQLVYYLYVESGARDNGNTIWIGASDDPDNVASSAEGSFQWADGSSFGFESWASGEPNNQNEQDCGLMWRNDLTWDDEKCSKATYYVCSVGQSSAPAGAERRRAAARKAEAKKPTTVDLDTVLSYGDVTSEFPAIRARKLTKM